MKILLTKLAILFSIFANAQQANRLPPTLGHPGNLVIDSKDNLYVNVDAGVAKITPAGKITVFKALDYRSTNFCNISVIDSKDNLYGFDGAQVYKITISTDDQYTATLYSDHFFYPNDNPDTKGFKAIRMMTIDNQDNLYVLDDIYKVKELVKGNYVTDNYYYKDPKLKYIKRPNIIKKITLEGMVTTLKNADGKYVMPNGTNGMTCDGEGNIIYTTGDIARSVEKINVATGTFIHIAGKPYKREWCPVYTTGDTTKAELFAPQTIIVNKKGELIYADERSHRITKIADGKVSTIAGNNIIDACTYNIGGRAQENHKDGKALVALFNFPKGLAYDSKGNLYISDCNNACIRKISTTGIVSSFTNFDRLDADINKYSKDDK